MLELRISVLDINEIYNLLESRCFDRVKIHRESEFNQITISNKDIGDHTISLGRSILKLKLEAEII